MRRAAAACWRRLGLGRAAPRVDAVDAVAQLQHEGGRRSLGGPGLHGGPQQAEAVPVVPPPAAPSRAVLCCEIRMPSPPRPRFISSFSVQHIYERMV